MIIYTGMKRDRKGGMREKRVYINFIIPLQLQCFFIILKYLSLGFRCFMFKSDDHGIVRVIKFKKANSGS